MKEKEQRINFVIPREVHKELKIIAIKRNITLKELILREIIKLLNREKKYE